MVEVEVSGVCFLVDLSFSDRQIKFALEKKLNKKFTPQEWGKIKSQFIVHKSFLTRAV